jgi:hypothetical protein
LLWHEALISEMSQLSAVEARKAVVGSLLWWLDCSLLRWWDRSMVELLLLLLLELPWLELWAIAPVLLLLWSVQLTHRWGIHYAVLGRSTARTTTGSGSLQNVKDRVLGGPSMHHLP